MLPTLYERYAIARVALLGVLHSSSRLFRDEAYRLRRLRHSERKDGKVLGSDQGFLNEASDTLDDAYTNVAFYTLPTEDLSSLQQKIPLSLRAIGDLTRSKVFALSEEQGILILEHWAKFLDRVKEAREGDSVG